MGSPSSAVAPRRPPALVLWRNALSYSPRRPRDLRASARCPRTVFRWRRGDVPPTAPRLCGRTARARPRPRTTDYRARDRVRHRPRVAATERRRPRAAAVERRREEARLAAAGRRVRALGPRPLRDRRGRRRDRRLREHGRREHSSMSTCPSARVGTRRRHTATPVPRGSRARMFSQVSDQHAHSPHKT